MFHKKNFCHVSSTNRGCPQYSIYVYKTTDSVETMLTEGYFNEALLDLQKNDVIAAAIISESDNTEYERVYFRVTQRTLDSVSVEQIITDASDISFDGTGTVFIENAKNVQEALNGLDAAVDTKVSKSGDTMTGTLNLVADSSIKAFTIGNYRMGLNGATLELYFNTNAVFTYNPAAGLQVNSLQKFYGTAPAALGSNGNQWSNVYTAKLNNGTDIAVPTVGGTLTLNEVNFQTPVTDTNKGATMKEIIDVQNTSIKFKGFVSTTEPSSSEFTLFEGNMWINASAMPTSFPVPATSIRVWDGAAWQTTTDSYSPAPLDAWRNENDNEGYYWFGGVWTVMSTDLSPDYFALDPTDGKWDIKDSVNLPGNPTTTTPSSDSNNTQIATTAWVRDIIGASIIPTGTIIAFAGKTAPDGFLKCDGSALSRRDYAGLFAVIGATYSHGVYAWMWNDEFVYTNFDRPATGEAAEGVYFDEDGTELGTAVYDESTGRLIITPTGGVAQAAGYFRAPPYDKPTFDLPDYRGVFLRGLGGNSSEIGTLQLESVPNITGQIGNLIYGGTTTSTPAGGAAAPQGAIYYGGSLRSGAYSASAGSGSQMGNYGLGIDASLSNEVYGRRDEVAPKNYAVLFCIKY